MKVEFQNGQFTACMNDAVDRQEPPVSQKELATAAQHHVGLILGIVAFISALIQIPYGFAVSTCAELMLKVWGASSPRFTVAAILGCVILAAVAVTLSILSLVIYTKHGDSKTAGIGRALAVIALVICGVATVANAVCFVLFLL